MLETIKKLDKKTLVLLGCMILIPILLVLFLVVIKGCSSGKVSYEKYEGNMISAAEKYFKDNDLLPKEESATATVELSKLVDDKYIKDYKKRLDDDNCSGKVTVRMNGSSIEENEGGYLNYTVELSCDNYKTQTLKSLIMADIATENSGLYKQGDYYIFKGDDVDNYVEFYGVIYRILNMDKNGILKLVKVERELTNQTWDTKYNIDIKNSYGINIYKDSSIRKRLLDYYNTNKKMQKAKAQMISYDVCVDSRDINDLTISDNCSQILENQPITLINITDFANASLDKNCVSITSKSCRNYNYLKSTNLYSWTVNAVSNNSYEVYYLSNGSIEHQEASKYVSYNLVIYVDSEEMVKKGKGTEKEPYVINSIDN